MLDELYLIAKTCRHRNLNDEQYLNIVARYVNDIKEGHHKKMHLDLDFLEMKFNFEADKKSIP